MFFSARRYVFPLTTTTGDPRAQSAADLIVAIIPELLQQAEGERLLKSIDQDFLTEITRVCTRHPPSVHTLLTGLSV